MSSLDSGTWILRPQDCNRNNSMVAVAICPECRAFVTRYPLHLHGDDFTRTLLNEPEPLDSNDAFHWSCFFCGFSQLPAEWTFSCFAGNPTPPMEELGTFGGDEPKQMSLF